MTTAIPIEIHTRSQDTATVNGQLVHRGHYESIHDAALAVAIGYAQAEGKPLLAKAIDGDGVVWWINVHPDGQSFPADPPQLATPEEDDEPKHRRRRRDTHTADFDEADFYAPAADAPDPQGPDEAAEEYHPEDTYNAPQQPTVIPDPAAAATDVSPVAPQDAPPPGAFSQPQSPSWDQPPPEEPAAAPTPADPPTPPTALPADQSPTTGPIRAATWQPSGPSDARREPYAPYTPQLASLPQPQTHNPAWNPGRPPFQQPGPPPNGQGPVNNALTRPPAGPPPTFLTDTTANGPEPIGWNGFLRRLGFKTGPTDEQRRRWSDERAVSRHWTGPRTIAVVNGKGGATKTPTTAMLSAVFARHGGSGVCAWDANFTRGTLGWRTEQGAHERTILELVPHLNALRSPSANSADLAGYLHHQTQDKYDILRSNPRLVRKHQMIQPGQQDGIHQLLTKHYRLVFIDSGNDESDAVWLRIIEQADALVVPALNRRDHAEAAKELLQGLREGNQHSARLADHAVVVISHGDRDGIDPQSFVPGFQQLARSVVTIPYDDALGEQWLRYDNLQPATQRAWLRAAAATAEDLSPAAGRQQ